MLFVHTGASRTRLEGRISDLQAMAAQHPLVTALAQEVPLGAAVLEDLEQHGPAQNVWTPLTGGTPALDRPVTPPTASAGGQASAPRTDTVQGARGGAVTARTQVLDVGEADLVQAPGAAAAVLEVRLLERVGHDLLELLVVGANLLGIEEAGAGVDGEAASWAVILATFTSWGGDA